MLVLLTAMAAWFTATNLAIDTSTTDMISADTPFRRNAIEFDEAFPQFKDLIVIVVDAPTPEDAEIVADHLVTALREKPALFERVERPGGDRYFARNGLLFLEPEELQALADRLAKAEPLLASLAQQPNLTGLLEVLTLALREGSDDDAIDTLLKHIGLMQFGRGSDLSWRELIDLGTRKRQIVLAKAAVDSGSLSPGDAALAEIRNLVNRIEDVRGREVPIGSGLAKRRFGTVSVRVTGSVALDHEELQSAALGGRTAGLISLVLVTALLIVGLRSASLILPALITLIAGLIWTAAFATLAVGHLNLISVAFAVLFVGLGIDFSIHFCLRYREALGEADQADKPLETAAFQVAGSLAIGAVCAALGFLSFLPTDYKGLAELGVISAGGMLIALFLNLTLLPALLAVFPPPTAAPTKQIAADAALRIHRTIVLLAVLFGVVGGGVALRARFDFNPMNLKDPDSESVIAFHSLAKDSRNGIYATDLLAPNRVEANRAAERLKALFSVGNAVTIDSLVPGNQPDKLAIIEETAFFLAPVLDPPEGKIEQSPEQRLASITAFQAFLTDYATNRGHGSFAEAAARTAKSLASLLAHDNAGERAAELERSLTKHLPKMLLDLRLALSAERVTIDDLPGHVRDAWIAADGRARIQLWPAKPIKGNDDLRRFAAAVLAAAPTAVGTPVTITEAGEAVVKAFRQATVTAFIAVCVVLLLVLRRVADTVLVLFPLVLAAIFTGATSVLLGIPFNFANVIVLPLLFGLGVASGIHLVIRARRAADTRDLMRTSTPRAVLFSALTTIASFGSLALSGHRGMTSMGQLLTIAIAYTLLCTLIVLPSLMIWIEDRAAR